MTLVVVDAADLSLAAMHGKVAGLLPLRALGAQQPIAAYLDRVSEAYRNSAEQASWSRRLPV